VQAKPELTETLRDLLISIMPMIKSSDGGKSVQLYQSQIVGIFTQQNLLWRSSQEMCRWHRFVSPRTKGKPLKKLPAGRIVAKTRRVGKRRQSS
jgi:hypothetical protein